MSTWRRGERAPWLGILLVVGLVQAVALIGVGLWEECGEGCLLLPYFPLTAREGDWQGLDQQVRSGRWAAERTDEALGVAREGLVAQEEVYRQRNLAHEFNTRASTCAARMLFLLPGHEQELVMRGMGKSAAGRDPLLDLVHLDAAARD